ncbi:MAG: hypothetical protein JWO27_821 [Frankiales bacterium]|nr:hypothetical protein [Frankiales bacterium]
MAWLTWVASAAAGLALVYGLLLALLWCAARRGSRATFRDALRLLPDLVRLVRRLAGDASLPRGVRVRLGLLLLYLASPIDLVPDFIPVLGYADDAVIVAIALRSVARHAGREAIERHWPGTAEGLELLYQLAGLNKS